MFSQGELLWQSKSFCSTTSFLIGCHLPHLTRSAKISALHPRAWLRCGVEGVGSLGHRHPPGTQRSPPWSWLPPGAFWHQILNVPLKRY